MNHSVHVWLMHELTIFEENQNSIHSHFGTKNFRNDYITMTIAIGFISSWFWMGQIRRILSILNRLHWCSLFYTFHFILVDWFIWLKISLQFSKHVKVNMNGMIMHRWDTANKKNRLDEKYVWLFKKKREDAKFSKAKGFKSSSDSFSVLMLLMNFLLQLKIKFLVVSNSSLYNSWHNSSERMT